ncbi:MAG TPA: alpha/beta hydrolase [Chloroflexia bacterium]|nr:alpha/beta hydrolase [Chloroflexia bacterium]
MSLIKSGRLSVLGASLYYEVRGSGPLLLLIAGGGGGGSGDWNGFVNNLSGSYTVVTYDRRGALNSPLDQPVEAIPLQTHTDDASLLLTALTQEPAYIFGTSAGALIGLDLVSRYPQLVRKLLAHEPPAHYLLEGDNDNPEAVLETFKREGGLAALRQYAGVAGLNFERREAGVELPEVSPMGAANAEALFKYTFLAVRNYRLDFEALKRVANRIVLARGSAGSEGAGYRGALAIAQRLGTEAVEFPSNHNGYLTHPRAFATKLCEVLATPA